MESLYFPSNFFFSSESWVAEKGAALVGKMQQMCRHKTPLQEAIWRMIKGKREGDGLFHQQELRRQGPGYPEMEKASKRKRTLTWTYKNGQNLEGGRETSLNGVPTKCIIHSDNLLKSPLLRSLNLNMYILRQIFSLIIDNVNILSL